MGFHFLIIQSTRLGLAEQIGDPSGHRLYDHLRALALEETEHVEISISLGEGGPELAGDLYHRLYLRAIALHLVDSFTAGLQGFQVRLPVKVLVYLAPGVPKTHELVVALEIS